MADKVPNLQQRPRKKGKHLDKRTILLNIVWWLLPKYCRDQLWSDFYESYRSPRHLVRQTVKAIGGFIRSQTKKSYYGGMALINTSSAGISGRVHIFDQSGNPMPLRLNGVTQSIFSYTIAPRGSLTLAPRDSNSQSPF